MSDVPNPGGDDARSKGCICAVLDNNHGKFAPWPPDGWWITEGCSVHAAPVPFASVSSPSPDATVVPAARPSADAGRDDANRGAG